MWKSLSTFFTSAEVTPIAFSLKSPDQDTNKQKSWRHKKSHGGIEPNEYHLQTLGLYLITNQRNHLLMTQISLHELTNSLSFFPPWNSTYL